MSNDIYSPRHSDQLREFFGNPELEGVDFPGRPNGLSVEAKEQRTGLVKIKAKDLDYGDIVFLIVDWAEPGFYFVDSRDFAEFYRQGVPQRSFTTTFVQACCVKSFSDPKSANDFKKALVRVGWKALDLWDR